MDKKEHGKKVYQNSIDFSVFNVGLEQLKNLFIKVKMKAIVESGSFYFKK